MIKYTVIIAPNLLPARTSNKPHKETFYDPSAAYRFITQLNMHPAEVEGCILVEIVIPEWKDPRRIVVLTEKSFCALRRKGREECESHHVEIISPKTLTGGFQTQWEEETFHTKEAAMRGIGRHIGHGKKEITYRAERYSLALHFENPRDADPRIHYEADTTHAARVSSFMHMPTFKEHQITLGRVYDSATLSGVLDTLTQEEKGLLSVEVRHPQFEFDLEHPLFKCSCKPLISPDYFNAIKTTTPEDEHLFYTAEGTHCIRARKPKPSSWEAMLRKGAWKGLFHLGADGRIILTIFGV